MPAATLHAQTDPSDKQIMDSLLKNDPMLKMINELDKPSSYVRVSIAGGNKLYSSEDKSVESLQNAKQVIISPSIGYYHKSGFGISFAGFLMKENATTHFYQYTITPSFEYTKGKVADFSLSYTRYILQDAYSTNTSPIQNQFYGTVVFKKRRIKPGLAAGYATGSVNEIVSIDTVITILNQQVHIRYVDSAKIKVSSLSLAASVEHSFTFFNLFSIKDGLSVMPQLSLIGGTNRYRVSHNSSLENYTSFTKRRLTRIRHFQSQSDNGKFQLQSAGLDLDVNYTIGKIYVEPEMYVDYYLPASSDNRFTQIYTINLGITF